MPLYCLCIWQLLIIGYQYFGSHSLDFMVIWWAWNGLRIKRNSSEEQCFGKIAFGLFGSNLLSRVVGWLVGEPAWRALLHVVK